MNIDFEKILPALIIGAGVIAGVAMDPNLLGGWEHFDPLVNAVTLAVAAAAWLRSMALERKLEVSMEHKSFQLTLGLREGYLEDSPEHSLAEAQKAYRECMQKRVDAGRKFVTGLLDNCTLTFPVRNGEGGFRVTQEPGCVISGSLSPHYDKGRSDHEVTETLNDLARHLGTALGQVRVYVSFAGRQWTVDIQK